VSLEGFGKLVVGDTVQHQKFGVGTVVEIQIGEGSTLVNIQFSDYGSKWLIAEFAGLKSIKNKAN